MVELRPAARWLRGGVRALGAVGRWIGWWLASGLVVSGTVAFILMTRWKTLNRHGTEACLALAVSGILLGMLLWRRRRSRDGAFASMILTSGFWLANWIIFWRVSLTP